MNRALIVKSFFSDLEIKGYSTCEDVSAMEAALGNLDRGPKDGKEFYAGAGGTTMRFLLSRLSRIPGEHTLVGDAQLMNRPHDPLLEALRQLGVQITKTSQQAEDPTGGYLLVSQGWRSSGPTTVDSRLSSQFASSLVLSAWGLDHPLVLDLGNQQASRGYLDMTLSLLKSLGMDFEDTGSQITIPQKQILKVSSYAVEPDMSSAFSLACFAGSLGRLELSGIPETSLQPDFQFLQIFREMGIPWTLREGHLTVEKAPRLMGGNWNLANTPDLFPVLSVLLTQADGPSYLTGLETLVHKESHRVESMSTVLRSMGAHFEDRGDGFWIAGQSQPQRQQKPRPVAPAGDHRVAMAITLAEHLGYSLKLETPEVVRKSFPDFFAIVDGETSAREGSR